ncbi:MAG: nuclear transport factor 2 family protein [Deltaproteobacteria bacterium]|nr:nuclear transport factor 2 family protein [Deltaproteobacteria bacterium]
MKRFAKVQFALAIVLGVAALRYASAAFGAEGAEATHNELRALKDGVTAAFNKLGASGKEEDLDAVLRYAHKNVVLNAMNGARAVGHDGIRRYFRQTMVGENRTVQSVQHEFNVDALSVLYGDDTAIAYGDTRGKYVLTGGVNLDVKATWLGTMVKENDKWLIAGFQFAPSIFENPIAQQLERTLYWLAAAAGLVGLLIGYLLGRRRKARSLLR